MSPRSLSVRTRVIGTVVLLSALGITAAEVLSTVVQLRAVDTRTQASLFQEVEEFRQFAAVGRDPRTGRPFTSLGDLFEVALQRNVPNANETFLTLVAGAPAFVPRGERPFALERDVGALAELAAVDDDGDASVTDELLLADGRRVRYSALPVQLSGAAAERGLYVVAVDLDAERAEVTAELPRVVAVDALVVVLVGLAGWTVATRLLAPLTRLGATARRITDTDLSERIVVTGSDDVSELARTVNSMLDRLQTAIQTQRQFLDDVGHELRTPVTIVRGHLELLDPDDPRDVRETRDLLLDELDRTARLVEDLVLLGKAEQSDLVRPGPVDLAALTDEIAGKARGLGERRWRHDGAADAVVELDAQRVTQALLQLAANAVRHAGPAATIGVGSSLDGGTVRLWVRDDGPGIPAEQSARVFERFARGGPAGRAGEGSGLGLAIVRVIAVAHGGHVELTAEPGGGARFTLVLPGCAPDPSGEEPALPGPADVLPAAPTPTPT